METLYASQRSSDEGGGRRRFKGLKDAPPHSAQADESASAGWPHFRHCLLGQGSPWFAVDIFDRVGDSDLVRCTVSRGNGLGFKRAIRCTNSIPRRAERSQV
jgi:hypothetical protein